MQIIYLVNQMNGKIFIKDKTENNSGQKKNTTVESYRKDMKERT
jgi:hypothetical protein